MSVWPEYIGLFGNNLFQYSAARLYATINNFKLSHHENSRELNKKNIIMTTPEPDGKLYEYPKYQAQEVNDHNIDIIWKQSAPRMYVFRGYFQQADRYWENRDLVKSFFVIQEQQRNTKDLVIHIRCGDYTPGWRIHPEWYHKIIENEQYDRLYIVMSPIDNEYLDGFKKYNPIVVSNSTKDDFLFLSSFDKMICSNSTFCWWAAFFGNPSKVYTFKRWIPVPEVKLSQFKNSIEIDGKFINE